MGYECYACGRRYKNMPQYCDACGSYQFFVREDLGEKAIPPKPIKEFKKKRKKFIKLDGKLYKIKKNR
jgi:predicted ATP-dependent serine protease